MLWLNSAPSAAWEPRSRAAASLERHVEAFRDVGAETGADRDAATDLLGSGVAGPDRIAAGTEEGVGVRRLGLGGVERVMRVGLEDPGLLDAAAVGLDVDDFLVVARQRQADRAAEIFRGLGVEDIGVGFTGRGVELSGGKTAAAGNPLVVAELEIIGMRHWSQRQQQRCGGQANFHDEVHPNHPYELYVACEYGF